MLCGQLEHHHKARQCAALGQAPFAYRANGSAWPKHDNYYRKSISIKN
jgi:hypothetical protein